MYCHTTNHFQTLPKQESYPLFKNSNTKFPNLIISFLSFLRYCLLQVNFTKCPIFTIVHSIFKTFTVDHFVNCQLIMNFSLAFIIVTDFMCFAVVIKRLLRMGIMLILQTLDFFSYIGLFIELSFAIVILFVNKKVFNFGL